MFFLKSTYNINIKHTILLIILIISISVFSLVDEKKDEILTRAELAKIIQDTFKFADNEKLTELEQAALKSTIDEATYTLKTYKKRIYNIEKKQKAIKKDFFNILKKDPSITGNDFDLTLTAKLDYNNIEYDDTLNTRFKGFRNLTYIDMMWKPDFDTTVKLQFLLDDIDWDTNAGNTPVRTDIIKQAYLQIDNLTAGHFPFTLGGGLLLDARVDGMSYDNNDLNLFILEEGATSTDDDFNVWGVSYRINNDFLIYFSSISMTGQTKRSPFGILYNKTIDKDQKIQTELLFHKYDKQVILASDPTKTDDLFTSLSINYTWQDTITLSYINMKEGPSSSIGGNGAFASDDMDLRGMLYSDLGYDGNVKDIYFRYDKKVNSNLVSLVYETLKASDAPSTVINPSIHVTTLAFSRPLDDNSDLDLFYTYISNNNSNTTGLITDPNDIYVPALFTTGVDENILKMQLTYHF